MAISQQFVTRGCKVGNLGGNTIMVITSRR